MRALVLGSDGFLGKQLLGYLTRHGRLDVVTCARETRSEREADLSKVACDLTGFKAVCDLLARIRPEVVINVAGTTFGDARALYLANAVIPANVAYAISAHHSDCHLIHVGSAAEYGHSATSLIDESAECHPISLYGHSKLAATNFLMSERAQRGLKVTVLRPFNMVAEINSARQVLGSFVDKVLEQHRTDASRPIRMGYLGAIRDFFCVDDLFLLILRLVENADCSLDIINVCSGQGRTARDIIHYLAERLGNIKVDEETNRVAPKAGDTMVGNPARFLAATGLERPTPLEHVLDNIWRAAGLEA